MDDQALSFGVAAAAYDQIRPSYPTDAVRWAVGDARRVVDLGAGTGILTRVLLGLGLDVVPVEPDAGMRDQLAARSPGVTPLAGSAEAIPLPDGSVDAVVAGQAYHWFDRPKANAEAARVLRPGGVFAPLWNIRDDCVAWVAELSRLANDAGSGGTHAEGLTDFGPEFEPIEVGRFRHEVPLTEALLIALMSSRSYFLTATPDEQAAFTARIRELVGTHPELAGRAEFAMPYVTEVHRARRR